MGTTFGKKSDETSNIFIDMKCGEELKCNCPRLMVVDSNSINHFVLNSFLDKMKVKNKIAIDQQTAVEYAKERAQQHCCTFYTAILIDGNCPGYNYPKVFSYI